MLKFQLLPVLSDEDFAALKADIEERGVLVPVEYDEDGEVLDGHHRLRACAELGIGSWPRLVRTGLSDDGKRLHARQLNLARRHLNRAQKRELIAAQLKDTPEKSNRQIAEGLKVDHKTVQAVRSQRESIGEIPQSSRATRDGRVYPAERKPTKPSQDKSKWPAPRQVVLDPEFQEEANAAARDLEIERDERIALAGADELVAENEKLAAQVRSVTGDVFKAELYRFLTLSRPEDKQLAAGEGFPPGYVHVPDYMDAEWCRQLVAERRVRNKAGRYEWKMNHQANEALDCRIYARAALWTVGVAAWRPAQWLKLRTNRQLDETAVVARPPSPPREGRGCGGWLNSGRDWLKR